MENQIYQILNWLHCDLFISSFRILELAWSEEEWDAAASLDQRLHSKRGNRSGFGMNWHCANFNALLKNSVNRLLNSDQ